MRTTNLIRAPPEPRPTPSRSREMRAATSDFNLGPLTTTFKPPPSCSFPVVNQAVDPPFVAWLLQSCYTSTHATNDLACRPTPVASAHPGIEWGYYSPGLICPSGWVHACSATASTSSDFKFQFTPKGEETAVGCCPRYAFCPSPRNLQEILIAYLTLADTFVRTMLATRVVPLWHPVPASKACFARTRSPF